MALRVSSMQLGKRSYSVLHFPSRSRKMTSSLQPSHQPSGRTSVVLSSVSPDSCLNPEAITTVRKQHVQPLWVGRGAGPGPASSPAGSALFTADSGGQRGPRRAAVPAWSGRAAFRAVAPAPPRGAAQLTAAGLASGGASGNSTAARPGLLTQRLALPARGRRRAPLLVQGWPSPVTTLWALLCDHPPAFSERFALTSLPSS